MTSPHVARSLRSSPDPSTAANWSAGNPASATAARTTATPAAVVPPVPNRRPSSLVSNSAVVLSLWRNICPTIVVMGGDCTLATVVTAAGVTPWLGAPSTLTPTLARSAVSDPDASTAGAGAATVLGDWNVT